LKSEKEKREGETDGEIKKNVNELEDSIPPSHKPHIVSHQSFPNDCELTDIQKYKY
jgi:hypothetical protein